MKIIKKITHYLLFIFSFLLIISGYGISEYRIVEKYTFGLMSKSLAFELHSWLSLPFIIILVLHIFFVSRRRK